MSGEEERALLSASQPVAGQGWIPVSERLPGPGQTVLCYWPRTDNGAEIAGWQFATAQCWPGSAVEWHNPEDDEDDYAAPSHWMPLPAAPSALSQPSAGTAGEAEAPSDEAEFELCGPDDICLAGTIGRRSKAWAEICFYAAQFAKEGPLTIYEVTRKPVSVIGLDASRGGERASGVAPSPAPVVDMERLRHLERVLHEAETAGVKGRKP